MKAQYFTKYGTPNVLQIEELDKPTPKDDEVLIKVIATSINDWDIGLVLGKPYVIRLLYGIINPKKVKVPGVDVAGKIETVGKNVKKLKPGDNVFGDISESGFGSFAEYVCAKESAISLKPDYINFIDAAALPHASILAVQGLIDQGKIKEGQKVLINGAGGGVGTIGIQLAKIHHVDDVTGVDNSTKLDMLLSKGFKKVLDYEQTDFTKTGEKYDLIFDVKTNRSIFRYAKALNKNGIYVTVGGKMRRILQAIFLGWIISLFQKKKIIVVSLKPNKDLEYIKQLYQKGILIPVIDENTYSLSEVPEALKYFSSGKHKGKIIIKVDEKQLE